MNIARRRTSSVGIRLHLLALCLAISGANALGQSAPAVRVYVGTYTGPESRGIYRLDFDPETGQLGMPSLAAETSNPSFLAIHPSGRFLYAVNEDAEFEGQPTGSVTAFAIRPDGTLVELNRQPSGGAAPCHIALDRAGTHALVANYAGGSVAALPIGPDGRLGPPTSIVRHVGKSVDPRRQEDPHAHSINLDAAGRFAVAADLGLDQLLVYRFDADRGTLTPNDPPATAIEPGSGPRHFAFHPDGKHAYAINELSNTISVLDYDPDAGRLTVVQTIPTLPDDFQGRSHTAEVVVHPTGRFVYGSNRGHDSLAIYRVEPETGRLVRVGIEPTQGKSPRNFAIEPSGRFLLAANGGSNNILVFRIDLDTGKLTPTGSRVSVPSPVCVRFLPVDRR